MNLSQEQSSVSVYFTKLKTVWEELNNYKPVCTCGKCTCGGVKALNAYSQMEYVMSFLMGLHDSFAQIRGQLLLIDPLPPINKVFSLVSQEERQRKVGIPLSDSTKTMAFATKPTVTKNSNLQSGSFNNGGHRGNNNSGGYRGQKKERPFCTYCQFHGHTIDRCYKLPTWLSTKTERYIFFSQQFSYC
ncbi:hypothetical protein TorRG33x02_291990 [Trema orientale]|uniref:Zinc finger, CCHC-type n=1 Tax=Trema orientale TaxID=63057 RepID=A0A2P5CAN6_TREOI|nr:hypothetical protein TorRG33x02_291990 [Trema orientale]